MQAVVVNANGQITIPARERRKYRLKPGSLVRVLDTREGILLQKAHLVKESVFEELRKIADAKGFRQADIIRICREVGKEAYAEEIR